MKFEYFEIRPCIEESITGPDGKSAAYVGSYADEGSFEEDVAAKIAIGSNFNTFWTLYGRYNAPSPGGASQFLTMAIGDFETKADAHQIMNAILAPMAAARDAIRNADHEFDIEDKDEAVQLLESMSKVADGLDDFINQCSNAERI